MADNFVAFAMLLVAVVILYKLWRKSEDAKDLIIKENSDLKTPVMDLIKEVKEMLKELMRK